MSKLINIGRRFSRACFACLGGAFLLVAIGAFFGNLYSSDWQLSALSDLHVILPAYAIFGTIFLTTAFGIYKSKRWGAPLASIVSFLVLLLLANFFLEEKSDPDAAIVYSIPVTPMVLTLVWSLAEIAREWKGKIRGHREQGGQIA